MPEPDWKSLAVQMARERDRERKRNRTAIEELLKAKRRWTAEQLYNAIQAAMDRLTA